MQQANRYDRDRKIALLPTSSRQAHVSGLPELNQGREATPVLFVRSGDSAAGYTHAGELRVSDEMPGGQRPKI
jgi:hypothetical protein